MSGFLLRAAVQTQTERQYMVAVREFVAWCQRHGGTEVFDGRTLDWQLLEYFEEVYLEHEGRRRQHCINICQGIRLVFPDLRLPVAGRALQGWERLAPPTLTPPMPYGVCLVIVEKMVQRGRKDMGVITWLMFEAYLRIGEALAVRGRDVSLPTMRGRERLPGGISIRVAKTGRLQSVLFRGGDFVSLLERHLSGLPPSLDQPLFCFTYAQYLREFTNVLESLGLGEIGFRPHSLRHGGAVHDYLRGHAISDIIHRGRWASESSARTYLQTGRSMVLGSQGLPQDVAARAGQLQSRPSLLLSGWAS